MTDDESVEGTEDLVLSVTVVTVPVMITTQTATVMILDNDCEWVCHTICLGDSNDNVWTLSVNTQYTCLKSLFSSIDVIVETTDATYICICGCTHTLWGTHSESCACMT